MNKSGRFFTYTLALFSVASMGQSSAADWPQFRGPKRDGICQETGLLKQWPAAGPTLLWEAKGLGQGYSTVSVVGDRIYTDGQTGDGSFVIALNVADGNKAWTAKFGKATEYGGYVGPRGAPTVDGNLLFTVDPDGELVCLDTTSGTEKWRKSYTRDLGGKPPSWGFAEAPLVDGENLIVTPGGSKGAIAALNKATGQLVWQSKEFTDSAQYASLVPCEIGGVKQYVQLTASSVAGIAAADGKLLWKTSRHGSTAVIPTPIVSGKFVYVTSGYGAGCNLFRIAGAGDKFSATEVYANKVMVNHHGGVIKVGDFVYGYSDGKGWTCQDFKSGDAKWQEREKLGKGSLLFADGHFYLRDEGSAGTVALIEASPEGYKESGRFKQPHRSSENSWPHPVIANGRLYLRDQDILLCYDVKAKN